MRTQKDDLAEALALMEQALSLLDSADCTLDAVAHLDLAVHRLREQLGPEIGGDNGE